jgi:prepilin-type N-terminal cleavage/methylation domain-containing protein
MPITNKPSPSFLRAIYEGRGKAVTLIELLIVLMIIGLLVTAAVKTWDVSLQRSRFNSTIKEMEQLSWAIAGNPDLVSGGKRSDFGYVGDIGLFPPTLKDLNENVSNFTAWHGPYIKPAFQESPQSYMMDAWGDTYIYPNPMTLSDTSPIYIRSYAGSSAATPQNWLTKIIANRKSDAIANQISGDVADAYGFTPGVSDRIKLILYYTRLGRNDSFVEESLPTSPDFAFLMYPIGIHKLRAWAYHRPDTGAVQIDSAETYVCVFPRIGATDVKIRFSALKFGGQ